MGEVGTEVDTAVEVMVQVGTEVDTAVMPPGKGALRREVTMVSRRRFPRGRTADSLGEGESQIVHLIPLRRADLLTARRQRPRQHSKPISTIDQAVDAEAYEPDRSR